MAVVENFIISDIKLDIKGKNIPFGFSNNTILSMF